uniref:Uncharacterized protein n=1 Tax=Ditylenchus dipsaci TaxID=166011 RepID=A0A915EU49_9BILA
MGDGDKTIMQVSISCLLSNWNISLSLASVNIWGNINEHVLCARQNESNQEATTKTMENARQALSRTLLFYSSLFLQMNSAELAIIKREWQTRYAGQFRALEVCAYFSKECINSPLNGWFEGFAVCFNQQWTGEQEWSAQKDHVQKEALCE